MYITKSDINNALQCLKMAYLKKFKPEVLTPPSPYERYLSERGNLFGEQATKEFPHGIMVQQKYDKNEEGIARTNLLMEDLRHKALFEASFSRKDLFIRTDIMERLPSGGWKLIEVKSGSKLEEKYKIDAAIQAYVLKDILELEKIELWHVNKECELPDMKKLFTKVDLTEEVKEYYPQIRKAIKELREVFSKKEIPEVDVGVHCKKPFSCPALKFCLEKYNIPEVSVMDIPRIGERAWDYIKKGKTSLNDLDATKFTMNQQRMILCTQGNKKYFDKDLVREALGSWTFPLYCLDIEAKEYDLPSFEKTGPTQQIPFQYSIHKIDENLKIEKVAEYLHKDGSDPRKDLLNQLLKDIPDDGGSVVAYSMGYEKNKLLKAGQILNKTDLKKLEKLLDRLEDPLPIIQAGVYYPEFKGSFSIKYTGPAMLGATAKYDMMKIKDGTEAILAFNRLIKGADESLRKALLEYCDKDTLVLAQLVKYLYKKSKE